MHHQLTKQIIFYTCLAIANLLFATILLIIKNSNENTSIEGLFTLLNLMPLILGGNILLGYAFLNYKKVTTFQTTSVLSVIFYTTFTMMYECYDQGYVSVGQAASIIISALGAWVFTQESNQKKNQPIPLSTTDK